MDAPCPVDIIGAYAAATSRYRFVVEVTERSLADDPGELMAAVGRIRDVPAGVAIDDVGAEPASLALMPLVAPDVIKLDLRLIQARPTPDVAAIVNAVMAESERTGALILAEGVENEAHVNVARAMGATLGQGWFFGHPKPLPMDLAPPSRTLPMTAPPVIAGETPFEVASTHLPRHLSTRELLAATSRHLELEVLRSSGRPVVLSGFELVENFDQATRRRYERLAPATALIAAFGVNMPEQPAAGVRGAQLSPDDPLSREWAVAVLDSYFSAALTARTTRPGDRSQWEVAITHNRDLVLAVARQMLQRLPGIHR